MSNITPVNIEYISEIGDHILKAEVEHLELARRFSFYFDDKLVSEKAVDLKWPLLTVALK